MLTGAADLSRRGQWRNSFLVYSESGSTDPTLYLFKVRLWPDEAGCGCSGWSGDAWLWSPGLDGLSASTDDGTGKLVAMETDAGLVLTWLFPVADTQRLCPGAYAGSITAALASDLSDVTELASFTVTVRP